MLDNLSARGVTVRLPVVAGRSGNAGSQAPAQQGWDLGTSTFRAALKKKGTPIWRPLCRVLREAFRSHVTENRAPLSIMICIRLHVLVKLVFVINEIVFIDIPVTAVPFFLVTAPGPSFAVYRHFFATVFV